jgi:putative hydrolase of the HAD superfamily
VDLYLFDFDKTLYAYDFHYRLPDLALAANASQYQLASRWWADGYELRAEAGEWPTAEEYLDEFARVTGSTRMSVDQWAHTRMRASTPIAGSVAALRHASTLGTVSVLSNNPSVFAEALPIMAPDVCSIVGENRLVSAKLGVRKPDPLIYTLALEHFGARPEDTFFTDDVQANVDGALALGIHAHHFTTVELLDEAITTFERRPR